MTPERLRDLIATVRRNKSPFLVGLLADAFEELGRNDYSDRERAADLRNALAEREHLLAFSPFADWMYHELQIYEDQYIDISEYVVRFGLATCRMLLQVDLDLRLFIIIIEEISCHLEIPLPDWYRFHLSSGVFAKQVKKLFIDYATPFWQQFVTDEFEYAVRRTLLKVRDTAPLHDNPTDEFPPG